MLQEPASGEPTAPLATSPVAGAGGADAPVSFPALRLPSLPFRFPVPRVRSSPRAARVSMAALVFGALLVVLVAVAGPSVLAPRSTIAFPGWDSGPLGLLIPRVLYSPRTIGIGYSVVLVAMFVAYIFVLAAVRTLSIRMLAAVIIGLHLLLLLAPPLQLNDVFNYMGFAHLGGLHHLNPYSHVIREESFDPVYRFATWDNLRSPYGPLFTELTYPLAFLPLPVAYWLFKVSVVALSLGCIALVWQCARQLGRDPRFVVALVALNPIYLMYAVGGFHNDFFMLVPMLGAVSLMLAGRDRRAGAVLALAVAVKFTAVILLPFLLVAVVTRPRQIRILVGALAGGIPMIGLSLLFFGLSIPNLAQQSAVLTNFSVPNLVGLAAGAGGGSSLVLRAAAVGVVLVVVQQAYRGRTWLNSAGWSTVALIASLGWLMPWYVIWLLPLAGLATSVRLRRVVLVLTAYLILTFMPVTHLLMERYNFSLLGGSAGRAAVSEQNKLSQN
jgi:alpha-1,6-mannosyltransferase